MEQLIIQITNNFNKILSIDDIKKYSDIYWGGNGIGNRFLNKKYNYSVIYKNKKCKHYIFTNDIDIVINHIEPIIKLQLDNFFMINNNFNHINNGIVGIFVISKIDINNKLINNRQIRRDIIEFYRKMSCVVCGSSSELVCDHKNDLYNDMRVLNTKTQTLDDFQSLCNHCNLQKRQVCKNEEQTGKIYSAKNIQRYKIYPFEFPWEKKVFDKTNIYCKNDTYWFDPVEFDKKIYYYISYVIPIITEIKNKVKKK